MHEIECPHCYMIFDNYEYEDGECPNCRSPFYYEDYIDEDGNEVGGYFWD